MSLDSMDDNTLSLTSKWWGVRGRVNDAPTLYLVPLAVVPICTVCEHLI